MSPSNMREAGAQTNTHDPAGQLVCRRIMMQGHPKQSCEKAAVRKEVLGDYLSASVTTEKDAAKREIHVFLSQSCRKRDDGLQRFTRCVQAGVTSFTADAEDFDSLKQGLWETIMNFSKANIHAVILELRHSFDHNRKTFGNFLMAHFDKGITGDTTSEGYLLGDRIIRLSQVIQSYKNLRQEMEELTKLASDIHLYSKSRENLNSLIGETLFANELSELICKLGFPERAYNALLLAARCTSMSDSINFHVELLSPAKRLRGEASTPPPRLLLLPPPPPSASLSDQTPVQTQGTSQKTSHTSEQEQISTTMALSSPSFFTSSSSSHSSTQTVPSSLGSLMDVVQPFLDQEDKGRTFLYLQPHTKQEVAQLFGSVLRGKLLPIDADAWYAFGFVCTENKKQERDLGGIYRALITKAPPTIFSELHQARQTNTITALLDRNGYSHFRQISQYLAMFLSNPPHKRPTVWRLKQFILDDQSIEPPACLKRDYGFKFCKQRNEVTDLKKIYSRLLEQVGPKDLHHACEYDRLLHTALKENVLVPRDRRTRFLQNDFPSPVIGFDNEDGLDAYRMPLFKRGRG